MLAPNAKLHAMVVPQEPEPPTQTAPPADCEAICAYLSLALSAHAGPVAPPASASAATSRAKVVFDKPSAYGRVIVVEEGHHRILRFDNVDGVDQSTQNQPYGHFRMLD